MQRPSIYVPETLHLEHARKDIWLRWFRINAQADASAIKHLNFIGILLSKIYASIW